MVVLARAARACSCLLSTSAPELAGGNSAQTLPHEVGHWVDFRRHVLGPLGVETVAEAITHPAYRDLMDRWYARPEREREEFAHSYAAWAQGPVLRYLDELAGPE